MLTLNLEDRKILILKIIAIFLSLVVLSSSIGIIIYKTSIKEISLLDNNNVIQVSTFKNTVADLLKERNIVLNAKDTVYPSLDTLIETGTQIKIKRAISLVLQDGIKKSNIKTTKETVNEVLQENQIVLNEKDKVSLGLSEKLVNGLILVVTRVTEDTITEQEKVAFKVSKRETTSISRGFERLVKQGRDGLKESTYKATYENGELASKELIKEKVIKKPIAGVVEVGIEPREIISRGETLRYAREITMSASAYTAGSESTGKNPGDRGYGVTASGMKAQRGVVAVDTSVIPLGTKLYIESLDGHTSYGYAVAADRGSAIRGNKIDLFYESLTEALSFGRRNVKVYILE